VAAQLGASQEGLSSMSEWVMYEANNIQSVTSTSNNDFISCQSQEGLNNLLVLLGMRKIFWLDDNDAVGFE
jgi:hypothetical protein